MCNIDRESLRRRKFFQAIAQVRGWFSPLSDAAVSYVFHGIITSSRSCLRFVPLTRPLHSAQQEYALHSRVRFRQVTRSSVERRRRVV